MLVHKTSLSKYSRIEIMSSTFSYNKFTKLESNYREKNGKKKLKHMESKQHDIKKKSGSINK